VSFMSKDYAPGQLAKTGHSVQNPANDGPAAHPRE
jgi:hypothetical protein